MANKIDIVGITSSYDGKNVSREVRFQIYPSKPSLELSGDLFKPQSPLPFEPWYLHPSLAQLFPGLDFSLTTHSIDLGRAGFWFDNDGVPGLSKGDVIELDGQKLAWDSPMVKKMAEDAENIYADFLKIKKCIADAASPVTIGPERRRTIWTFKCDRNGGVVPEKISQFITKGKCGIDGDIELALEGGALYSVKYESEKYAVPYHPYSELQPRAGLVYDFPFTNDSDYSADIEVHGASHPDLAKLKGVAKKVQETYMAELTQTCEKRRSACEKLYSNPEFDARIAVLKENGGLELYDQCEEIK